ncbi:MAG: DUF1080 domain-containing protein [Thermoguttaceae bacterium]|nr:DUF1080 domain-containing protein [Thermoguttaceae bacterium]
MLFNRPPRAVVVAFAASFVLALASCSPKLDGTFVSDVELDESPKSEQSSDLEEILGSLSSTEASSETTTKPSDAPLEFVASEPRDLFNGRDLTGWVDETGNEPKGWVVDSGALRLVDPENGGDILTAESFDNYVLTFEWRYGRGCNSGVKYKIEQPNGKGWIGPEYQVQDDANVDDGKVPNRKIASLFDMFPAKESTRVGEFPAPEKTEPDGEFRQGKIVVLGNSVEHWIDGEKVLAYEIGSREWIEAKSRSKFKSQKNFGLVKSSPILFQAHGFPIDFKSISVQTIRPKE